VAHGVEPGKEVIRDHGKLETRLLGRPDIADQLFGPDCSHIMV